MTTPRLALVGAIALLSAMLSGCGGTSRQLSYAKVQISELERQVAQLEADLAAERASGQHMAPAPVAHTAMPSGDQDFSVFGRDKDVVVSISNEILFRPGSDVLNDSAKKTLDKVVGIIRSQYPDAHVRVEGHTDNQPVTRSKDKHRDNWDLSGNRAQSVLQYLKDKGVSESKLGFAGYGKERPVSSNGSPSGQSQNRRVEIVVITNPSK